MTNIASSSQTTYTHTHTHTHIQHSPTSDVGEVGVEVGTEIDVMEEVSVESTEGFMNEGREKNCDTSAAIVEEGEGNTEEEGSPGGGDRKKS